VSSQVVGEVTKTKENTALSQHIAFHASGAGSLIMEVATPES